MPSELLRIPDTGTGALIAMHRCVVGAGRQGKSFGMDMKQATLRR